MRAKATRSAVLAGKDQLWTAASMREQATHSALLAAKMVAVEKEGRQRQQDEAFAAANPQPEVVDSAPPSPSPKRRERRFSTGPTLLRVFPFARRSSQVSPAPSSTGETPTNSQSTAVSRSGSRRNSRGSNSSFQRVRRVSVGGTISVVISESFQKTRRLVRRRSSAPAMTMTADGTSAAVTEGGSAEPTLAEAAAAASALVPDYTPPPTPPQAGRGPVMLSTPVAAKIGAMSRLSEGTEDTSSPRGTSTLEYASESLAATPWDAGVAAEAVRADSQGPDAAGAAGAAGGAPAARERDTAVERSGNVLSAPQLATPRPSSPWRWRPHAGLRARRSTAPQHGQSPHMSPVSVAFSVLLAHYTYRPYTRACECVRPAGRADL